MPLTVMKSMVENTNAPGFDKILLPRRKRSVWIFFVLFGAVAFVLCFAFLFDRWLDTPVVLETKFAKERFIFPDVTICHTGAYSMWRSSKSPERLEMNLTGGEAVYAIKNFWKHREYEHLALHEYTREDNRHSAISLEPYAHGLDLGHHAYESIPYCKFGTHPCSYKNFSLTIVPLFLNCFTFSPPEKLKVVKRVGLNEGLSLILADFDRRVITTDLGALDFARGFMVVTHAAGTVPDFFNYDLGAVGSHTKIEVQGIVNENVNRRTQHCHDDEDVISLCTMDHHGEIIYNHTYTYDLGACKYAMAQEEFIEKCGCLSEFFNTNCRDASLGFPYCHSVPKKLLEFSHHDNASATYLRHRNGSVYGYHDVFHHQELEMIDRNVRCHDKVYEDIEFINEVHKCHLHCTVRSYRTMASKTEWPESKSFGKSALQTIMSDHLKMLKREGLSSNYEQNNTHRFTENLSDTRERFARVTIFPGSGFSINIIETLGYPFTAFISDVGGMLGLWIGFSVMHILEMLDGLFTGLVTRRRKSPKIGGPISSAGQVPAVHSEPKPSITQPVKLLY